MTEPSKELSSAEIRAKLEAGEHVIFHGHLLVHPDQTPSDEDLKKIRTTLSDPSKIVRIAPPPKEAVGPFRPKIAPKVGELDLSENGTGVPTAVIRNTPPAQPRESAFGNRTADGEPGPETSTGVPKAIHDRDLPPEQTAAGGDGDDPAEFDDDGVGDDADESADAKPVTAKQYSNIKKGELEAHVLANREQLIAAFPGDQMPDGRKGTIDALVSLGIAPPASAKKGK